MTNSPILKNFIVFEGIDGSGTTTQLSRLSARLRAMGIDHRTDAEPTGGSIGTLIRLALSGTMHLLPESIARLFAADRGEHLYAEGGIVQSCTAGQLRISDRYLFSSLAYQGLACGESLPTELNMHFPLPELCIFFRIDPTASMARISARPGRDIYETMDFQTKVAERYQLVLARYADSPMQLVTIDASKTADEVEAAVWQALEPVVERISSCR